MISDYEWYSGISPKEVLVNWGKGIVINDFYRIYLSNEVCKCRYCVYLAYHYILSTLQKRQ